MVGNMGTIPPKRVKREPLATATCEANSTEPEPSLAKSPSSCASRKSKRKSTVIVKSEPIDIKEEEDDDEPLTPPDPNKPKNYPRIRRQPEDDEGESNGGFKRNGTEESKSPSLSPTKKKSKIAALENKSDDDDDEYLPLVSDMGSGSDSEDDISGSESNKQYLDKDKINHSSNRNITGSSKNCSKNPQSKDKVKPKRNGVRTRRQKAANKEESSSSYESQSSSDTKSLNGFIVSDDQEASDPEDLVGSKPKQAKAKKLLTTKTRSHSTRSSTRRMTRNRKDSSSSEDDLEDLYHVKKKTTGREKSQIKTPGPRLRKSRRLPAKAAKSDVSSSSSRSDSPSPLKKEKDLTNDVVSEIRRIIPTCTGVSYRRKKRNRSGGSLVYRDGGSNNEYEGMNSDESFIDNDIKYQNTGILESSSSSDEDVEEEDPEILELDSNKFDDVDSTDSSSHEGDAKSDKSQSSSGEEALPPRNIFQHEAVVEKCELCTDLGDIDVRHRDSYVDSNKWCQCGQCKVVSPKMHNYDRICCKEIQKVQGFITDTMGRRGKCITDHPQFENDVLKYGALKNVHSKSASKMMLAEFRPSTDREKVLKCRNCFLRWVFGRIGGNMVVPACVVTKIRQHHAPSAGPLYFDPFKVSKTCQFGKHCTNAKNRI